MMVLAIRMIICLGMLGQTRLHGEETYDVKRAISCVRARFSSGLNVREEGEILAPRGLWLAVAANNRLHPANYSLAKRYQDPVGMAR